MCDLKCEMQVILSSRPMGVWRWQAIALHDCCFWLHLKNNCDVNGLEPIGSPLHASLGVKPRSLWG